MTNLLCFVSYCVTHPLRVWDIVDESEMETADRVASYQTDFLVGTRYNVAMLSTRTISCCGYEYMEGVFFSCLGVPVLFFFFFSFALLIVYIYGVCVFAH